MSVSDDALASPSGLRRAAVAIQEHARRVAETHGPTFELAQVQDVRSDGVAANILGSPHVIDTRTDLVFAQHVAEYHASRTLAEGDLLMVMGLGDGSWHAMSVLSTTDISSTVLSGTPTAPTPPTADDSTRVATTAYVQAQGYITASALAPYAPLASPSFSGAPAAPTPGTSDNSTRVATTAFVKAQGYATLASPVLTGSPTAPTPATADNSTAIATTAFVKAQGYASASSSSQQVFAGEIKAPDFAAAGLTGATAATRYVGGTASGSPTSGSFAVGDWVISQDGRVWVCTAAGSPGIWRANPRISTGTWTGGPPASPVDGDIWIATGVTTGGVRWQFQYNASSSSAYKWEFIGGPPVSIGGATQSTLTTSTWTVFSIGTWTAWRGGDYEFPSSGANGTYGTSIPNSTIELAIGENGSPGPAPAVRSYSPPPSTFDWQLAGMPVNANGLAAGTVLSLMGFVNGAGYTFSFAAFTILPVRIA